MNIKPSDRRTEQRHLMARRAHVSDQDNLFGFNCAIRDGTTRGCKIVTSRVADLPNKILIRLDCHGPAIPGRIAWRDGRMAGVEFDEPLVPHHHIDDGPSGDAETGEKEDAPAAAE